MKPLIVLIAVFAITLVITKVFRKKADFMLSGNVAMSVMLLFTSVGHFVFRKGMAMMLPNAIPFKEGVVMATGVLEILAAIGLLLPRTRKLTGWLLILFFILILPANVYAAMHGIDIEAGTTDGPGTEYLWFRVPLQLFFIAWVYFFSVRGAVRGDRKSF